MDPVTYTLAKRYTNDAIQPLSKARADANLQGYVLDDMREPDLWNATQGTVETYNDDPDFPYALKITASQGSSAHVERPLVFSGKNRFVSFRIKVLDGNFDHASLTFSANGLDFTHRFQGTVINDNELLQDRWRLVTVPFSQLGAFGTPNLEDIRVARISIVANSNGNAEVLVADLRVHDDHLGPAIIWNFDDGERSQYTRGFATLQAAGFVGQIAVATGRVGQSNYCTLHELQEMHAAGWGMLNHTVSGQQLNSGNVESMVEQIDGAYAYLRSNGLTRCSEHFVYPGGNWNEIILKHVMARCHTARLAGGQAFTAPYVEEYGLLRPYYMTGGLSLSTAKSAINRIKARGGVLYMTFHRLVDSTSITEDWLYTDFQELVAYAKEQGIRSVVVSDVWSPRGDV